MKVLNRVEPLPKTVKKDARVLAERAAIDCQNCTSTLEFERKDCEYWHDQRYGDSGLTVRCPVCGQLIYIERPSCPSGYRWDRDALVHVQSGTEYRIVHGSCWGPNPSVREFPPGGHLGVPPVAIDLFRADGQLP